MRPTDSDVDSTPGDGTSLPKPVTVMNVTGDGKPHALQLEGDSEVAQAYQAHLEKPEVKVDDKADNAETLTHYLAIFREQGIAFHFTAKKVDIHHAAAGALFFNQTAYEVVTPAGRSRLAAALTRDVGVRDLSLCLIEAAKTLADAPRTEVEAQTQSKVDLHALISSLAGKAKTPDELAAALLKLIK